VVDDISDGIQCSLDNLRVWTALEFMTEEFMQNVVADQESLQQKPCAALDDAFFNVIRTDEAVSKRDKARLLCAAEGNGAWLTVPARITT
jgi:hypothetical protein